MTLGLRRALGCLRPEAQLPIRGVLPERNGQDSVRIRIGLWVRCECEVRDATRAGVGNFHTHEVLEILEGGVGRAVRTVAAIFPLQTRQESGFDTREGR